MKSTTSIVLDCDSRESQELACAVEAGYGDLPRPNVAAQRASSGHLHLGWNLRTPVHRGAASRPRPLAALGRIAEYYAVTLRSDRGYVGVLAYNPIHSDYATVYPRAEPLRPGGAGSIELSRPTGDGQRERRLQRSSKRPHCLLSRRDTTPSEKEAAIRSRAEFQLEMGLTPARHHSRPPFTNQTTGGPPS